MKLVLVHDGPREHALAITSVFKPLQRQYPEASIHVITSPDKEIFYRFLPGVNVSLFPTDDAYRLKDVDLLIDYGGSDRALAAGVGIQPKKYLGLCPALDGNFDVDAFMGLYTGHETKRNIFQVVFAIAGLKWRGEGYSFSYHTRTRAKKDRCGLAVKDAAVRQYLRENLVTPDDDRLWHIPIRQNVFRQFDEVNKCENVVTDDPFVMHVAVSLRKRVEFLLYEKPNIRPEFFGSGCVHLVPENIRGSVPTSL